LIESSIPWLAGQTKFDTNDSISPGPGRYPALSRFVPTDMYSVMQALLIIILPISSATLADAAAIPDFNPDFIPSLDWILGEPTVLDPVEQSLEQTNPYSPEPKQDYPAEVDPFFFEMTPSDPSVLDPPRIDPFIPDGENPSPGLLDPNDPYSFDLFRGRPNCGDGMFGPNVPLCCDGFMMPGGAVVSGCQYFDPGKKICKNTDNVVCCQSFALGSGYVCRRYY
jgi:hypothetical protein